MNIGDTIAPTSEQLDSVDLLQGPRTFVIESVSKGPADQPVQLHLRDFPRPWRPGLSMRRILVACWGPDASQYIGRRVRLFCDPTVVFGGAAVGGTRIAALSHIDKPKKIPLLISRGKSAMFTVEPLPDEPPAVDRMTPQQGAKLGALFTDAGITDRGARLDYCRNLIGRDLAAASDLTSAEAEQVLTALAAILDPADTDAPTLDGGPA